MTRDDFQHNRPIFVRGLPLTLNGKTYQRGDHVPWMERGLPVDKITRLFRQGQLHHNEALEEAQPANIKVGDGLEAMTVEQLGILVDKINEKVKVNTKNQSEYFQKHCKKSTVHAKQCGYIRSWRISYGHLEV
jgi:hypothetical protein